MAIDPHQALMAALKQQSPQQGPQQAAIQALFAQSAPQLQHMASNVVQGPWAARPQQGPQGFIGMSQTPSLQSAGQIAQTPIVGAIAPGTVIRK